MDDDKVYIVANDNNPQHWNTWYCIKCWTWKYLYPITPKTFYCKDCDPLRGNEVDPLADRLSDDIKRD